MGHRKPGLQPLIKRTRSLAADPAGSVRGAASQLKLMSLDYRLIHLAVIISIAALLLTGSTEHGLSQLPFHIAYGLLSLAVLGAYSLFLLITRRVRLFDALKKPLNSQIGEGLAIVRRYTLGTPYPLEVEAKMTRHNILAAYASLVLALSFVPLTLGGVAMVFLQRGTTIYEVMKATHLLGVGLIALFFLVHFLAVIHPENRPLLRAMFSRGRVPVEWARTHLAGYFDESESRAQ